MSISFDEEAIGLLVHSYNNYLAGMMGFTELSIMESKNDSVNEKLSLVIDSGDSAVMLGKQLLSSVSRLQVKMQPVDIVPIVQKLGQQYGSEINDCEISPKNEVNIKTDTEWFTYCIETAFKFCQIMASNATIKSNLNTNKEALVLTINSPSLAFNKEQTTQLFEPFYSSRHLTKTKDLGLSFVRGFILQMKGSMEWNNEFGFVISIPICR